MQNEGCRNGREKGKRARNYGGVDARREPDAANFKIFQKVVNDLKLLPDFRVEKIVRIKRALATGTYKVDSRKVALKMLGEI